MNPILRPKRRSHSVEIEYAAPKLVPAPKPVVVPFTSKTSQHYRLKRTGHWHLVAREPYPMPLTRKEQFAEALTNVVGAVLKGLQHLRPLGHSR